MCEETIGFYREELATHFSNALVEIDHVYVPHTVGIISHWPFYDLFADWLKELVKIVKGGYGSLANRGSGGVWGRVGGLTYAPLERCLVNLLYEVPLPPPGRVELKLCIGQMQLFCSRPAVNTIQALQNVSARYCSFRPSSYPNAAKNSFQCTLSFVASRSPP